MSSVSVSGFSNVNRLFCNPTPIGPSVGAQLPQEPVARREAIMMLGQPQRARLRCEAEFALEVSQAGLARAGGSLEGVDASALQQTRDQAQFDLQSLREANASPEVHVRDGADAARLREQALAWERQSDPEWNPTKYDTTPDIDPIGLLIGSWKSAIGVLGRLFTQAAKGEYSRMAAADQRAENASAARPEPQAVISAPVQRQEEIRASSNW